MTNKRKSHLEQEQIDIAIVGGGPAGLQAALVLSRTRKKIIVFDDPESPRNAASHGIHNFLGLDGLTNKNS
jgi:thioredoxin reductase